MKQLDIFKLDETPDVNTLNNRSMNKEECLYYLKFIKSLDSMDFKLDGSEPPDDIKCIHNFNSIRIPYYKARAYGFNHDNAFGIALVNWS